MHAISAASSTRAGLSSAEARRRLAEVGLNVIAEEKPPSHVRRLLAQLVHLFALLLWAGASLALLAGMPQLSIAIVVVVLVNAAFAFAQEYRHCAAGHSSAFEGVLRSSPGTRKPVAVIGSRTDGCAGRVGGYSNRSTYRERDTMTEAKTSARAKAGDWVLIHGRGVGKPGRRGLIVEVLGSPDHEHYRVRWDEEHESIFYPGSDATISGADAATRRARPFVEVQRLLAPATSDPGTRTKASRRSPSVSGS